MESYNWTGGSIQTLYYQGMFASQVQASKYTGKRGFIATTGEHVICERSIDVIQQLFIGEEISEVNLRNKKRWPHPFEVPQLAITSAGNWFYGIKITNSTSDLTVASHSSSWSRISIAQETDIESHKRKMDLLGDDTPVILYGVSRGAATTFNAFARYKYPNVKMVILEGCFSSVPNVFQNRYGPASRLVYSVARWMFPNHTQEGPSPLSMVDEFPPGIPVVFVTSEKDTSVHMTSTMELVRALKEKNQNDVHVIVLKKSSHSGYMFEDEKDKTDYETLLHKLYKKYYLPYIPALADTVE